MNPSSDPRPAGRAPGRAVLAAFTLALLLGACGGSGEDIPAAAVADRSPASEPSDDVEERRFALWGPGEGAKVQAEQAAQDPWADGSTVQLIVQLNPAAVFVNERLALLGAAGAGESGDAAALRARQLAAKVRAVASASQAVLARSVLGQAPGAVVRQQFSHAVEGFVLSVPWAQADAVAAALARNPAVDSVEPDRSFTVGQSSAGLRTLDTRAWGVDRIDQRAAQLDGVFRHTLDGSGVNLYVVDTGINPHQQFGSRLAPGFSAIDDGRGTGDCNGHGTHVAGTAAGQTLGVAPGARVVPVRVMTCTGSSSGSSVLSGLDWIAAQGARPAVVNLSLGGPASSAIDAATQRLMTVGFSVVAAAGNTNVDACLQSPGRAAGVITVAASDRTDAKAAFSNWGPCVALWAPGTAIASAGHASASDIVTMNGTSMAAPHVAGAVALLLQAQPAAAPSQTRQQLLAQASADLVSGAPAGMTRHLLFAGQDGSASPPPASPGAVQPGPTPSPAPAPAATPPAVVVRSVALTTLVPTPGSWKASAAVTVVDQLGRPVAGAKVHGRFSNSSKETICTSDATGLCMLNSSTVPWLTVPLLGVAVTQVKSPALPYTGGGPRSAQVARPAAPQATLAALSGTMHRSKPAAVNWTPHFQVTVLDEKGQPLRSVKVQALMQVHSGARVAALKSLSCVTTAAGGCRLAWNGIKLDASHTGATVQVQDLQRNFLVYRPGALTSASVGRVQ